MRKLFILTIVFALSIVLLSAGTPRSYIQKVTLDDGTNPAVANTGLTTDPNYLITATQVSSGEVISTATHAASQIRISAIGTGANLFIGTTLQLGAYTSWVVGDVINMYIQYIPNGESATWSMTIPTGGAAINIQTPEIIPPYGPAGYPLHFTANYPGDLYKDAVYVGPLPYDYAVGETGTYTVQSADPYITWTNSPYVITDPLTMETTYRFLGVATPDPAWNPMPADMTEIHIDWDAMAMAYNLSWDAPATGPVPTGYHVWWQGAFVEDVMVTNWMTPAIAEGAYMWQIVPYVTDPAKGTTRSLAPVKTKVSMADPKGDSTTSVPWHFTIVRDPEPGPNIIPADEGTFPPGWEMPMTPVVAAYIVTWTGIHDLYIMRNPGEAYALAYIGGAWLAPDGAPDWTWLNVNFDLKAPIPVVVFAPTLPVELSSFTVSLTAQNFVKLTWVSQSETNMLGYRVYRNESNEQASAVMITPTLIGATNTSTMQTYSITDAEVEIGNTYWYWLESVDYGSSQFHGPVSILVEGEIPPAIPEVTTMGDAYPNPFRANGSTNIVVAAKESGSLTVYNILGQAVYTQNVIPGTQTINWNGKDKNGKACGSGIYFYKLSTPSMNQTKKMVIVK
jgi:hypothetical protein